MSAMMSLASRLDLLLSHHVWSTLHLFTIIHALRLQVLSPHATSLRRTISLLAMPFSGFMASHLLTSGATPPLPHWDRTLIYIVICSLWHYLPHVTLPLKAEIICLVDGVVRTLGVAGVAGELHQVLSTGDLILYAGISGCVAVFLVQTCNLFAAEWAFSSSRLRFNKDYLLPFLMAALYALMRGNQAGVASLGLFSDRHSHSEARAAMAVLWSAVLYASHVQHSMKPAKAAAIRVEKRGNST